MGIISVYIISKAGGLIFSHDMPYQTKEVDVTFNQYPVDSLVMEYVDRNIQVKFGEVQGSNGSVQGTWEEEGYRDTCYRNSYLYSCVSICECG